MNDWQTWTALGIVALTAGVFVWRALVKKKKPGCGGGCGCAAPKPPLDRR